MIWIFPIAGKGIRTKRFGEFKPFIKIKGKSILHWFLNSIKINIETSDSLIFVTTVDYSKNFKVHDKILEILEYENIRNVCMFLTTKYMSQGPAATVYAAKKYLLTDEAIVIANSDQCIDFGMSNYRYSTCTGNKYGFLPIYAEFGEKSSYVEIQNGLIVKIVEKKNISNLASAGIYGVSNGNSLIEAIEEEFRLKQLVNNEFYISSAINNLIKSGHSFYPTEVRMKYDLGSIEGIDLFERNYFRGQLLCTKR